LSTIHYKARLLRRFAPRNDPRGVIANAVKQSRIIQATVVYASEIRYSD
jgi:hypothetical protein